MLPDGPPPAGPTGRSLPLPPLHLRERVGATTSASAVAERQLRRAVWWHEDPAEAWLRQGESLVATMRSQLPDDVSLEGARVLDFGCGAGRVLRHLVDVVGEDGELHGVDIDAPSIDWLQANGEPWIHAQQCAEAPRLPYPDAHFDLVYALSVFTHIVDHWAGWLLELRRVLAPGGILLATVIGPQTAAELRLPGPDDPGMYARVLGNDWDHGGPVTAHHPAWVAERWGRALDIVSHNPRVTGAPWPHDIVVARARGDAVTEEDLLATGADPVAEGRMQAAQLRLLRDDALMRRSVLDHETAEAVAAAAQGRAEVAARAPGRLAELAARYAELEAQRAALLAGERT